MSARLLFDNFKEIVCAPGGIAKIREAVLQLAMQGKLVPQDPKDEPAGELLRRIKAEKERLIADGKIKREKPLPKIAQEELPYELPKGWKWGRLGELIQLVSGQHIMAEDYTDDEGGVPYLTGPSDFGDKCPIISKWTKSPKVIAMYNDLLITVKGSGVGKINLLDIQQATIGRQLMAIRLISPEFYIDYLYYFLKNCYSYFQQKSLGIAIPGIDRSDILNLLVPIPPLAEQQRIVVEVDALMRLCNKMETDQNLQTEKHQRWVESAVSHMLSALDELKFNKYWTHVTEHFDVLISTLEAVNELRKAVLQLAVQGRFVPQDPNDEPVGELLKRIKAEKERLIDEGKIKGENPLPKITPEEVSFALPSGWAWVRFGTISYNRDSARIPVSEEERKYKEKIYDYYGASGVIDQIDNYLFEGDLLLIGEDGANLVNRSTPIAFIAHGRYWVNNHAHVIDSLNETMLKYLCTYINSIDLKPYVTGTAQPKMNQTKMNSIIVALPPLAEQQRIVARVNELMTLCDQLEQNIKDSKEKRKHFMEATIAACC
jgi:Restriction endonuclease S subunits